MNDYAMDRYDIGGLPTYICFKNGLKVERMAGGDEEKLKDFIKKHISS